MPLPLEPFKSFEEMTPADYAEIGLTCGLEVHQQLLTDTKLFCRCPAGRYGNEYDAIILRHMRPTLSELGEYDGTALMEKKTCKNIYYRLHRHTVCTYEIDDTPPFMINRQAMDIAMEITLLLKLSLVGEVHILRKQYLDGSIPTGFQRTAILGVNGSLPYGDNGRTIGVTQLSIEEDSCREVSDIGHDRVYNTDRLGMPLIEVVTEPDMRTPEESAEVCEIIRRLCRCTQKVRTGYGAARQDVNVSVRGGTRVEIKGVPQISRIPRLIYNEARRQCSLLNIRARLHERGVTPSSLEWTTEEVTVLLARTRYPPLRAALAEGCVVRCVRLGKFDGILAHNTQEHTTFAREFADRVRVIACLTRLPNMVHSDAGSETLWPRDWQHLYKRMHADPVDALIVVWGDERDTARACAEIVNRAREATVGVPGDTRQGFKDGTNGFERVLPGADRMYPDTDLPPIVLSSIRVDAISADLPTPPWETEAWLEHKKLPRDVIGYLVISARMVVFRKLVDELGTDPMLAGITIAQRFKAWRRTGINPELITDDELYDAFRAMAKARITRAGLLRLLQHLAQPAEPRAHDACPSRVEEAIDRLRLHPALETAALDAHITQTLDRLDHSLFITDSAKHRFIMGHLMSESAGRADGNELAQRLTQRIISCAADDGTNAESPSEFVT